MPAPAVIRGPSTPGPAKFPFDAARPLAAVTGRLQTAPPSQTTLRYVRKTGSDSNGGTSPSDAWLTINKALTTVSPGTIIYVGAGVYREAVTPTVTPTAALPVSVIGDIWGNYTGDAGMVQWTGFTNGDKVVAPSSNLLNLNGKSFLTFQNLYMVMGSLACVQANTDSRNITFYNCALQGHPAVSAAIFNLTWNNAAPVNWVIDRCIIKGPNSNNFFLSLACGGGIDYDANFVIRNSIMDSPSSANVSITTTNTASGHPGGVYMINCSTFGAAQSFITNSSNISTTIPCKVEGCFIVVSSAGTQALSAASAGQIIEDYNVIIAQNLRFNVTAGVHSVGNTYAPLYSFGQERIWGGTPRAFGEPIVGSPLLAFGSDGSHTPYDNRGAPRGTADAPQDVGAFQRNNKFTKETTTVNTGLNAISLIGPGSQDFDIPVDAGSITISIAVLYDSSYTGPLPKLVILDALDIGIGYTEIPSNTLSLNTFQILSVTVVPTGSGVITVRLISADNSGLGKTIFDTFSVA